MSRSPERSPYDDAIGTEYSDKAPYQGMSPGRYLATRFSTLKPPFLNVENPIKLLRMLDRMQWAFFAVAFWAWVSFEHSTADSCEGSSC
jgi:hypothetical protein